MLTEINFTARDLVEATIYMLACIEWLARHGLIQNMRDCDIYDIPMGIQTCGGAHFMDG